MVFVWMFDVLLFFPVDVLRKALGVFSMAFLGILWQSALKPNLFKPLP